MSAVPAQKFREIVFQAMYSLHIVYGNGPDIIAMLAKELGIVKSSVTEAYEQAQVILLKVPDLDKMIASAAHSYSIERISITEKNILRLALYELFFDDNIPPKVAISEAVRLTRKFSTPQAAAFVNAVLDNLYKKSLGEPVNAQVISDTADALKLIEEISHEASQTHSEDKSEPVDKE
ncbi:MAG: transcription antitermination factor NusB [Nitrosomonas sp.]|nr:MAG: transcription antitermination factor NusB [Nitrosomonas sp.]